VQYNWHVYVCYHRGIGINSTNIVNMIVQGKLDGYFKELAVPSSMMNHVVS